MADQPKYGGELSLDQLSEMTRQQQQAMNNNIPVTKDGKPAPYIKTNNLMGNIPEDPLGEFVKGLEKNRTKVEPSVRGAKVATPNNVYNPNVMNEQQKPISMSQPVAPQPAPQKTGNMTKLDPFEIAPPRIDEDAKNVQEFRNKLITDLDNAIQRDRQEMWDNVVEPLYRQKLEEKMLAEENGTGDIGEESFDIDMTEAEEDAGEVGDFGMSDDVKTELTYEQDTTATMKVDNPAPASVEQLVYNPAPEPEFTKVDSDISTTTENDAGEYSKIITPVINQPTVDTYNDMASSNFDELFGDENDDPETDDTGMDEEVQAAIAKEVKSNVKPFSNIINLSEFTVSSKATSGSKILSHINQTRNTQTGTWALINAGRPIVMTAMYGDEIEKLNPDSESSDLSDFQKQKQIFSIFYEHIVDANKPATFEAWTKTIPAADVESLYFCAYRATFGNGSNYMPRTCSNAGCKNGWLDLTSMDSMVKYKDDATRKRVQEILAMDPTSSNLNIKATLFQISDELCIAVKPPSIYSMIFEDMVLNRAFKTKYAGLAGWIACIEDIYAIDSTTKQLVKIKCKVEPNNMVKTTNNKYKTYTAILKTLSSDQYVHTVNKINEVQLKYNKAVSYVLPETKCPKCGTSIPEDTNMNAVMAFFIRHRLQTATTTSNV